MKKSKDLAKMSFDFACELFRMRDLFPEEDKTELGIELAKEAVSVSACITTAGQVVFADIKDEFHQKAFSATFRIEVLLNVSRDLNLLETIEEQLQTLKKIRKGLKKIIQARRDEFPY
jgi:hypothetical protein